MRTRILGSLLILLALPCAFGGDIATFQNLGFSPDAKHFMFGQYGIEERSSIPYAELSVVEVRSNRFVPNGVKSLSAAKAVQPGNTGQGALLNLLTDSLELKKKYRIDFALNGRLLYILLDGDSPKEQLEFRDFQTGKSYKVGLVQKAEGSGSQVRSSFHITVSVTDKSGATSSHNVGNPNYWRKDVKRYRIRQIILAPDESSYVFIMEKEERDAAGSNIRFMVETVSIPR